MVSETTTDALHYLTITLLSLSLFCLFLFLLSSFLFKDKLLTFPLKLVVYLSLSLFFGFLFFLVADSERVVRSSFCKGAGVIVHFFLISNFGWMLIVALNFYFMICRRSNYFQKNELCLHLFVWSVASACVIGTGASGSYGVLEGENGDGFCYITSKTARLIAFFVPGLVVVSVNSALFFLVFREISSSLRTQMGDSAPNKFTRTKELKIHLSIFISMGLSWFFGYLILLIPSDEETAIIVFSFLFTFVTPAQGIFIFYFYCLNQRVLAQWAGCFPCEFCQRYVEFETSSGAKSSQTSSQQTTNV